MNPDHIHLRPEWPQSKEQIWDRHFAQLDDYTPVRTPVWRKAMFYAAAAAVVLLVSLPGTAYLYTTKVVAPTGAYTLAALPDGSQVQLNAASSIVYRPYWWRVSRKVLLRGEAYFEVAAGKQFVVESPAGRVNVLGTSFNVFDRKGEGYRVQCLTGRVAVAHSGQQVVLTPGMHALVEQGVLQVAATLEHHQHAGWMKGEFSFRATSLALVIAEVERQYGIHVATPPNIDYLYTGNFSRKLAPEQVLQIIGKPFGITLRIDK